MIVCKELNKEYSTKAEMFKALRENKSTLIAQKKMITKECDSISMPTVVENTKGEVIKAGSESLDDISTLKMDLIINTTKLMDSHSDVHLDGIWNKSVKEQKNLYLLQEHKMTFANIITDNVKASVKSLNWSELGADFEGKTQALVFTSEVNKDRNEFMFDQYAKGFVKNHSVGMRYVKLELALNSESKYDQEEKEVWDKYISEIANKQDAENQGYFWAVSEAKIIEGSAVPIGSNKITPVLSIEEKAANNSTLNTEPSNDTQTDTKGTRSKGHKLNKFI
jgi:hypothetical protein